LSDLDRAHRPLLDIVVPTEMAARLIRIAPRHHKDRQAMLDCKADKGIGRLKVEDVELVDARRHDQQRPCGHLLRRGRILNELKQLVFEHDRAF